MTIEAARSPMDGARRDYLTGVMFLVLGTIAFSSAGYFVRLIDRDAATILFWRGIFTALAILLFVVWRERRNTVTAFLDMGVPGIAVAVLSTISMASFIGSLQYTTVANNSIIFGTAPFLTAGIAWVMIRERPSGATIAFSLMALAGALLVVGSSLTLSGAQLLGDALALLMTLSFAVKTVLVRQSRAKSMIPAGCLGAVIGSVCAAPFMYDWSISLREIGLFALFGFSQQGAGLILTTIGIAKVPAAHAALLMALDLPMSPVWVWAAFGERPTTLALAGGIVVLMAILGHIMVEGWRRR
jgi:drug/metabolite transporter (DMT)-like permease